MQHDLASVLESIGLGGVGATLAGKGHTLLSLAELDDDGLEDAGLTTPGARARVRAAASAMLDGLGEETAGTWTTTADPKEATKDIPFANCFGMLFVPIPRFLSLFSIVPVRRCDYQSFCEIKLRRMPECRFEQAPDHPIGNVSWRDAVTFCEWITDYEHERGIIDPSLSYRLPTDLEWSAAVGLPMEPEEANAPRVRSGHTPGYPWDGDYPPPYGAGNYAPRLAVDEFENTSPTGSFAPNKFGIYDLGGNVWEWCQEPFDDNESEGFARGASCYNDGADFLLSSHREMFERFAKRANLGFRLVLSATPFKRVAKPLAWD